MKIEPGAKEAKSSTKPKTRELGGFPCFVLTYTTKQKKLELSLIVKNC